MVNDEVTERTVRAAQIKPGDVVLEVGPGTGALTEALVEAGARVIAVEKVGATSTWIKSRYRQLTHGPDVRVC